MRQVLDAIFYLTRTGCAWRYLPKDLPPWQTVYAYFRSWRVEGVWLRLNACLRSKLRRLSGRHSQPSVAILDSQSAKTTRARSTAVSSPAWQLQKRLLLTVTKRS
jgi:putative transposase